MFKYLHEKLSKRINVHFDYTIFAINKIVLLKKLKNKKAPEKQGL